MLIDSFPNDFKIVRDSVHGYIRIPSCYMREIVDTELFQRLRHIEQTSMRPLFPASRHDRFIHSLGVYHLGCRAFESLYRNAVSDGICEGSDRFDESWWLKHYMLFTPACLLHDCAHAAFSHTYENYYILQKPGIDANVGTVVGEEGAIARILGVEGFFNPKNEDMRDASTKWLGHCFYRSSDDDLNALFKWVYLHNELRGEDRNQDIEEFFGEYFSRPHHHAIWKSFGELEVLKRKCPSVSIPEYSNLPGAGQSMSSSNYVFVTEGDEGGLLQLTKGRSDLVAIEARAKLKSLDYAGILVIYDEETERLVDVLASSTSFTDPEPLMFVFETKS